MNPSQEQLLPIPWRAEYVILAISATLAVIYAYGQSNLNFIGTFSNAISPFEACAAFAMAALLYKAQSGARGGGMSRAYLSYSLGLLCWVLGESTWTLYSVLLQARVPFPSLADLFWLVGYIPLLLALLWQAWPFRDWFNPRKRIMLSLGTCVMAAVILTQTVPFILRQNENALATIVGVAYPILDTLLLSVAIPVFILFRRGTYWRPMLFVLLGIMFQLIGDLLFAQSALSGSYYPGSPADLIFDFSYLLLALGFYKALKTNLE